MTNKVTQEIKDHPLITIFMTIVSTVSVTWITTTFATMNYVDKSVQRNRKSVIEYVDTNIGGVKEALSDVKKILIRMEERQYRRTKKE